MKRETTHQEFALQAAAAAVKSAYAVLTKHEERMRERAEVIAGFNGRIERIGAQDDLNVALARREDFRQRRTEIVGQAFVAGTTIDENALDAEQAMLDKAIEHARRQHEREAAGAAVLAKLRDAAAAEADAEGRQGRPLAHALAVARLNYELHSAVPEHMALARRLARIRVCTEQVNAVSDPMAGLARVGVLNLGEVARMDLPSPPPVGAPDQRAFEVSMQHLVEQVRREIASEG
jgi:hypothetical protein